jgi:hypothetical protein
MQKIYHRQTTHKKLKHLVIGTADVSVYVAIYVTGSETKYVLSSQSSELSVTPTFHLQRGTDYVSKMSLSLQNNKSRTKSTNHGILRQFTASAF